MARLPLPPDLDRRIPRQQRAQASCAAIFSATERILQRDGLAGLSTNRIAEQAGVSIGTLYQYFPHKQAVLLEMGQRDIAQARLAVAAALAVAPPGEVASAVARALVGHFAGRCQLRRVLAETVFSPGLHPELAVALTAAMQPLARQATSPARLFVLTRAVMGVLHGAVMAAEAPATAVLEAELLALVRGFLAQPDAGATA